MRKTLLPIAAAALVLAGCATTYQLAVMPHDKGIVYNGVAEDRGAGEGPISITIEARTYTGTWVQSAPERTTGYVSGGFGWGRGWRWGGLGTTVTMDNPQGGAAKALLSAPDGAGLRCDFQTSGGRGAGFCRDDQGRGYDVQLRAVAQH